MRKVFLDGGMREGDAIAALLGDKTAGGGSYFKCLRPRNDSMEFEFIGFDSPLNQFTPDVIRRFSRQRFSIIEKLVWVFDGEILFETDGEAADSRIVEVSHWGDGIPTPLPADNARTCKLPCLDIARFILEEFSERDYIILKLDIEGAEYEVLQHLLDSGAIYRLKELYLEYHSWGNTRLRDGIESAIRGIRGLYYRNDWP